MDMLEPVFHGGLPAVLWKNMFQAYGVKGAIDLAAGEGEVCKAAILLKTVCGILFDRFAWEAVI
jgi:hypothetical protein